ncbi:MAG: hypothetical protein K0R67_1915 [Paenibacillus sp.]|jgi:hypothetical protein|nr:hypothetical protein [Paenibacillus sp.]
MLVHYQLVKVMKQIVKQSKQMWRQKGGGELISKPNQTISKASFRNSLDRFINRKAGGIETKI